MSNNGNGSQSFAERMSAIMDDAADNLSDAMTPGSGPLPERMQQASAESDVSTRSKQAAQDTLVPDMFSLVNDRPFAAAEVEDPNGTGLVTVLYPAMMPEPPGTTSTRVVSANEAMSIIATTPLRPVEYADANAPDLAFVPEASISDIVPDDMR